MLISNQVLNCTFISTIMIIVLGCWYLEETEATRIELVFAFSVLKGQELNELFDEHGVCEMVIDDAFPLLGNECLVYMVTSSAVKQNLVKYG